MTYAEKIEREDRRLDAAAESATALARRVRALSPHIGTYVETADGERLGVLAAVAHAGGRPGPGRARARRRAACCSGAPRARSSCSRSSRPASAAWPPPTTCEAGDERTSHRTARALGGGVTTVTSRRSVVRNRQDDGSRRTVLIALAANAIIAVGKLAGGLLSGSSAMLAEAVHSIADTTNQGFLLVRSGCPAASRRPSVPSARAWSASCGPSSPRSGCSSPAPPSRSATASTSSSRAGRPRRG